MPSIEIISLNSENSIYEVDNFLFAIQFENEKIESHRNLFYDFLKNLQGTNIHRGNTEFKKSKNKGIFAGKLIECESKEKNDFKLLPKYERDFKNLQKSAQGN